jgi:hypothetical protein
MVGRGGHRTESFTVPAGRRLVILHVAFTTWANEACQARVDVHGIQMWFLSLTTAGEFVAKAVRWTLYEGEHVVVSIFGADMAYSVDGYLLADDDGEPDDADNVITPMPVPRPSAIPEPLPPSSS